MNCDVDTVRQCVCRLSLWVLEVYWAQEGVAGWGGDLVCVCFATECAMGVSVLWSHVLEPVPGVRATPGSVLQQVLQLRAVRDPSRNTEWSLAPRQTPEDCVYPHPHR